MTKLFILCGFVVFLAVAVIWLLVGSALIGVHSTFDEEFFEKNCENAIKKEYDDMKLNMYVTKFDYSEYF